MALSAISGCRFGLGIWLLYYLQFTDFAGVGLVEALGIIAAFVFEVPTGILADRIGRKQSLVLANTSFVISFTILSLAQNLAWLLSGMVIFVLGRAIHSGSFEAFVFENLAAMKMRTHFERTLSKLHAWRLSFLAFSCVVGGFCYELSPRLPYVLTAFAFLLGLGLSLAITPLPNRSKFPPNDTQGFAMCKKQLAVFWSIPLFRYILLGSMLLLFCEEILDDALAVAFGFEPKQLGILFAVIYAGCAFISSHSHRFSSIFGLHKSFLLLLVLTCLSLLVTPSLGLALGGITIFLRFGCRTIWDNMESSFLNQAAKDQSRATLLSCYAMIKSLPYVFLAFPLGMLMDSWKIHQIGFALGIAIFIPISLFLVLFGQRENS